jgi:flagellar hook-length control protein FliK
MTPATLPVFAMNAPVQNGRFDVGSTADTTGSSERSFLSVMKSVMQKSAAGNQPVGQSEAPVLLETEAGAPIQDDAVTLSMIQQMLLNLPIATQMTQEQLQTLANDIFESLPAMQIQNGVIPQGLIVENVAKFLQEMKKDAGTASFERTLGQALSETAHALNAAPEAPADPLPEVIPPQELPDQPAKVAAVSIEQDIVETLPSLGKEPELPETETAVAKQTLPFVMQGELHQISDAPVGKVMNSDAAVTSIRDIHEPIRAAAEAGMKQMVLRLDPPGLGDVQIRLRMQQGVLTADLKVDSGSTKDLFTSALPQIRQQLETSGIQVGEIQVDLHEDYLSGQGQKREQDQGRQNRQAPQSNENFFEYLA